MIHINYKEALWIVLIQDDDITKELDVNPEEFKKELDKYDFDEAGHGDDDMREEIESRDMEVQEDVDSRQQ
jgi:hypothetical protein